MWRLAVVAGLLLFGGWSTCGFAAAQTRKNPPQAVILVQPQAQQALLSITFDRAIPHGQARARLIKLSHAAGWKVGSIQIADEEGVTNPTLGPVKRLGRQTGVSAILDHAPQTAEGGFRLQPYLEAFADLDRFDIFFFVPPDPAFQGLREYNDDVVHVRLVQAGGPYRYQVEIKKHTGVLPTLPLTQAFSAPGGQKPTQPVTLPSDSNPTVSLALVVLIACASGLLVLGLLLLRLRWKEVRRADARPFRS